MSTDWKKEYETEWNMTKEETLGYINDVIQDMTTKFYSDEDEGNICLEEICGFKMGIICYLSSLEKGLLPEFIKNVRVEAVKAFERTAEYNANVDIPQEFYVGYIKGFCHMYQRNTNSYL